MSFNIMSGRIRELVDAKAREQENSKKAELRALQAQINPHFLYNTLDTIIWMAESQKTEQVVQIVRRALQLLPLEPQQGQGLDHGCEEVERTRSYLTIQKMRYRDILDYAIEVDQGARDNTILKLILQPLVENALYHGIKNKRKAGCIIVRAQRKDDEVLLEVEDNGIGHRPPKNWQRFRPCSADDGGEIQRRTGLAWKTSTGASSCTMASSTVYRSGARSTGHLCRARHSGQARRAAV